MVILLALCALPLMSMGNGNIQINSDTARVDTLNQVDEGGRRSGWWRIQAPAAKKPGYQPGQLIEEGEYKNSRRVGVWTCYWPDGGMKSKITYRSGRPNGHYIIFYQDGKIEEQGNWALDRNVGNFKRYHPNGKLAQDFKFTENGLRDGQQKYFHPNGKLAVQVDMSNGQESGELKRWYENGDLQQVAEFQGGVINANNSQYLKPVKRVEEKLPDPGSEESPAVEAEEKPNEAIAFKRNGRNTLYDMEHRITQIGVFRNGRLWNGKFYRYSPNGHLLRIEMYLEGHYAGLGVIEGDDLKLVAP